MREISKKGNDLPIAPSDSPLPPDDYPTLPPPATLNYA